MPHLNEPVTGPLAGESPPKPGFFGGLLNRLFPAGAYGGMLEPEQLREEQNLALRRAGLSLLAGAGPRPVGTRNVGGDIAQALDPSAWQQRLGQVAEQSANISALTQKAQRAQRAQEIIDAHPQPTDHAETDQERDQRLLAVANAFQQAGLSEEAKAAADLRSSLRAPALTQRGSGLYDIYGNKIADLPEELTDIAGSQIYSTVDGRRKPFEAIGRTVQQYNLYKTAPAIGGKLSPDASVGLVSAARELMNAHSTLGQSEGSPLKALKNVQVVGVLAKILDALSGATVLSEEQRRMLAEAVDPLIEQIGEEQRRVNADSRRVVEAHVAAKAGKPNPAAAERFWNMLPDYPPITTTRQGAAGSRVNEMNRALGRPQQ